MVTFKNTGIETSARGVGGMVIGPDGTTLVVSVPGIPNYRHIFNYSYANRGDVLIFDLNKYNFETGEFTGQPTPFVRATLPSDGRSGKSPLTITATKDPNRFLVCNISDYDRGLSTLVITRNGDGTITGANMASIRMFQDGTDVLIDRLDIQRAQSAVLVTVDGVEYAIVADDNEHSIDQYWKAMYEAPMFVWTPGGVPIPVGGSASAKKVNVGGKIGIVKDPFGAAQYLGATLPLDGYGVVNLSLSEDGKVVLGQLQGWWSGNLNSPNYSRQLPSQTHVWNVEALVRAALTQPERDVMRKHIKLPPDAEQLLKESYSWVAGTYFDPEFVSVSAVGNMGDVIGVDLRDLAARQLLIGEGQLDKQYQSTAWDDLDASIQNIIRPRMAALKDFTISPDDLAVLTGRNGLLPNMKLVVKDNGQPYSRTSADSTCVTDADFSSSGVLFFVPFIRDQMRIPDISVNDELDLRMGKILADKRVDFIFHYTDTANPNPEFPVQKGTGFANVTAKDYATAANSKFFGDRPLDNPGYSTFALKGEVKADSDGNDVLDVYRVEQRLRYFGYPAMGTNNPLTNNTIQEFKADGDFSTEEQAALKLFEKVVRYGTSSITTTATATKAANSTYATATAIVSSVYDVAHDTYEDTVTSSVAPTSTPMVLILDQIVEQAFVRADAVFLATIAAHQQAKANATAQIKAQAAAELKASQSFNLPSIGADGMIEAGTTNVQGKLTTGWLNAYNAPHWMNLGAQMEYQGYVSTTPQEGATLTGWRNTQNGVSPATNIEQYGTSWIRDLMAAKQYAPVELQQPESSFNGAVDANYGFTPKWNGANIPGQHNTHDLGMAFDLGVSNYIAKNGAQKDYLEQLLTSISDLQGSGWSLANVIAYTQSTLAGGAAGLPNEVDDNGLINYQVSAIRDFLSLYALTQADGVTPELQAELVNTTAANLFGGMISSVLIGGRTTYEKDADGNYILYPAGHQKAGQKIPVTMQNAYPNINAVLKKLGIDSSPVADHQHHFHIYLKPPTLQLITANLLADAASSDNAAAPNSDPQAVLDYAQTLITGEELMFIMDVPYVPAQDAPIVLVQADAASVTPPADYILKDCQETFHTPNPRSAFRAVDPAYMLKNYLQGWVVAGVVNLADIKTTMLQGTQHGNLLSSTSNSGRTTYHYDPAPGFYGDDKAVFMAEYAGKHYKIVLQIKVTENFNENDPQCPANLPVLIKVTKPSSGASGYGSGYDLGSVSIAFADLAASALGQTNANGIILDSNAAGYNWFIDTTPADNSEYLPTSNPNEWVAKIINGVRLD